MKKIDKVIEKIQIFIEEDLNLKNVLFCIVAVLAFGLIVFLLVLLFQKLFQYLSTYGDTIITIAIFVSGIWGYWRHYKKPVETQVVEQKSAPVLDTATLQYNYEVLRKVLFTAIPEIASIVNFHAPERLSALDTPTKWSNRNGVTFYHYICAKTSDIDIAVVKEVLQTKISQMVMNSEIDGLKYSPNHVGKDGVVRARIAIDNVSNSGSFCEITMCFCSDKYVELLSQRAYADYENKLGEKSSWEDSDF